MKGVLVQVARSVGSLLVGYLILSVISVPFASRPAHETYVATTSEAPPIDIRVWVPTVFLGVGLTAYVVARVAGAMGTFHALFWSLPLVLGSFGLDHHSPSLRLRDAVLVAGAIGLGAMTGGFVGDLKIYGRE